MKNIFFRFLNNSVILYFLSALLLSLSFPKTDYWMLAWIGLVPLMFGLDGKGRGESFRLGYFCGVLFFGLMLYWIMFVTTLGAILLVAYFALYFGFFGLGYAWLSPRRILVKIFLLPALWVALEYGRANLMSGFGWVSLGYSQYQNLRLIQVADIVGVYGISFLIVMVNLLGKEALILWGRRPSKAKQREWLASLAVVVLLISLSVGYSSYQLRKNPQGEKINIGIVQGNVSHEKRWSVKLWPFILRDYMALSEQLIKDKVDLIVWPESAYPGYYGEEPALAKALGQFLMKAKTPHLIGMITKKDKAYFNSAVLFSPAGKPVQAYHKIHLVLFGEFIPFRKQFPFLAEIVPIDDFTRGVSPTLFDVPSRLDPHRNLFYSVLICFEDTVPHLVRGFVNNGAELLIDISNDAWFGDSKEPFLHLQSAVFRSIENRRYLVRCGNIGVSCFIDARGRILGMVKDSTNKNTYIEGTASKDVFFIQEKTLYTKFGDFFAYFCISGILVSIILHITNHQKRRGAK